MPPEPDAHVVEVAATAGRNLVAWSWAGTAVTVVTSIANALTGDRDHYALSAVPGLAMLALGSAIFLVAFAIAVQRSRAEEIAVSGLFLLAGSAPRRVQTTMLAAVAVQTAVPLAVALYRPFTAFATLAPVWSLGLAGLWGARHGTFPPRRPAAGDLRAEAPPGGCQTEAPDDVEMEARGDG